MQYKNDDSWEVVPVGDRVRRVARRVGILLLDGKGCSLLLSNFVLVFFHCFVHSPGRNLKRITPLFPFPHTLLQHVAIKTSALEVKGQAFNMLYCYLEYLQEHFYPHLMQTAALFSTHITFYYHDDILCSMRWCGSRVVLVSVVLCVVRIICRYCSRP